MLTSEQWREEIVARQFPLFREEMLNKGIATECKVNSVVHAKRGNMERVTVRAKEVGATACVFVLVFLIAAQDRVNILMKLFERLNGRSCDKDLLPPFAVAMSKEAVANALTLFQGAIFQDLEVKRDAIKKTRRHAIGPGEARRIR